MWVISEVLCILYDFIVITKYKVTRLLILLADHTHMPSTQCEHQHCSHTLPIYMVNDQLRLCNHPCLDDVK